MKKITLASTTLEESELLTNADQLNQEPVDENEPIGHNLASAQPVEPMTRSFEPTTLSDTRFDNKQPETTTMKRKNTKMLIMMGIIAVLAGVGTGFGSYQLQSKRAEDSNGSNPVQQIAGGEINKGDVFGIQDSETFKDVAQGYLEKGGINGEGSHRLLRPGGNDQTVYLTSTVTDLDLLVGAEIKVWGETYKGQKAGWLMDVGKVEILEVEGEVPFEEEL
jgi:hypothetical protein